MDISRGQWYVDRVGVSCDWRSENHMRMATTKSDPKNQPPGNRMDSFSDLKSGIGSEHDCKALLEAIPDMVFRLTRDGTFVFYKGDIDELYISPKFFVGKRIHEVMPEYISKLTMTNVELVLSSGKTQIYAYELSIPGKDNQHYECRMVKYSDDGVLATVRNITSQKIFEQRIIESETHLREIVEKKDKLFSIISHDLKNPFNAILGFSELLLQRISNNQLKDAEVFTKKIMQSGQKAMDLLMNLLDWARAQTDKLNVKKEPIDPGILVSDMLAMLNPVISKKQIAVDVRTLAITKPISADRNMISVVLRNLIINAVKYSYPGGFIDLSIHSHEEEVVFSVTDHGVGIPAEKISTLFAFGAIESTPGTGKETGTGLGLQVCKEFVELQGGRIWAESIEGEGSTFSFALPEKQSA